MKGNDGGMMKGSGLAHIIIYNTNERGEKK